MAASRNRRRRWIALFALLAAYGLLMGFGGCADRLLLYPSQEPITAPGLSRIVVATPQGDVEVWTAHASADQSPPEAYVLHFTGNASRGEIEAQIAAEEWAGHPVEIWSVNYPGYGGSAGPAKLGSIAPAALAVYDQLALRGAGKPIILSGRSLGTAAALYVAAHRPAAGLVLQNPPPLQSLILAHGWWNLWLLAGPVALAVPADLNSLRNAPHVTAPAVFVLAGSDTVVPPRYQQMVVDAYAGPKTLIKVPGADHNDPLDPASASELSDALARLLQNAAENPSGFRPSAP